LYLYRRHADGISISLQSYEHITRLFMYHRHRGLFDSHRAGSRFKARGYYASAEAARRGGRPFRASLLAASGHLHRVCRRDVLQRVCAALIRGRGQRAAPAPMTPLGMTLSSDASAVGPELSGPTRSRADPPSQVGA
jgi:hypothetical protein